METCPKCGYERTEQDVMLSSRDACPKCGLVYQNFKGKDSGTKPDGNPLILFGSPEAGVSRTADVLYFNYRIAFWLGIAAGAVATLYYFSHLAGLIDTYGPITARSSPLAFVGRLFGFQLILLLVRKIKDFRLQRFAFFSGLCSLGCLVLLFVTVHIDPSVLLGFSRSIFIVYFGYLGFSYMAFSLFGSPVHYDR